MDARRARSAGFTLVELLIVVAIIGVLAAIAIPNFLRFQLRAKTAEAKTNIAAIRTAQEGYFAEHEVYVTAPANPGGAPGSQKRFWGVAPAGFDQVGWSPEGDVYFVYGVDVAGSAFSISASGDLDGAGPTSDFAYVHPDAAGVAAAPTVGIGCAIVGVWSPAGALLNAVGPCTSADGQSEF